MATSDVDICNQALGRIGCRDSIASLQEQTTEGRTCNLYYATTRDEMLRAAQWNFARKVAYLSVLKAAPGTPENPNPSNGVWNPGTMPAPPWLYSYAYPSDCIRMRSIMPNYNSSGAGTGVPIFSVPTEVPPPLYVGAQGVRFIEGTDTNQQGQQVKCVLTNAEQALGVYTMRIFNPDIFDAQFKTAFISALAYRLARPLSGNKDLAQEARAEAAQAVMQARISDGNEGTTNVNRIPDFLAVRGYSGEWTTPVGGILPGAWDTPSWLGI